ncbi:prephenate dehydratase [Streptomyces guryensis]|uniref:prephenate dehydratase n=1 Tax=Streptomyces guryensis TaxID=2886947 RepID=A0A9Q3Z3N1_9ACTN|nr:prephenate dehydratase [Streptomyces guryensis]MCD9872951.1 prephenate dehydratase [Streptomyces guryensis]
MTYACLGPEGTFTQTALRRLLSAVPPGRAPAHRPFPSVPAALEAARRGDCDAAVVPLENSVRGVVPATMDQLASAEMHINAEVEVPVSFALMAPEGVALEEVTAVHSHPHALGQCEDWLRTRLPGAGTRTAASTAAAARQVAETAAPGHAAIAAPAAADLYGLRILAGGLGREEGAVTRFVAVAPRWSHPARTARERTSLLVFLGPGGPALVPDVLNAFRTLGIALSWIQSWPTGRALGSYHLFLDVDAHIDTGPLRLAMAAVGSLGLEVRFLGSYPRWTATG